MLNGEDAKIKQEGAEWRTDNLRRKEIEKRTKRGSE
jgi:hypothetical protein